MANSGSVGGRSCVTLTATPCSSWASNLSDEARFMAHVDTAFDALETHPFG